MPTGEIRIQITCADLSGFMQSIASRGALLRNVEYLDELTVSFTTDLRGYELVTAYTEKHGIERNVLKRSGIIWSIRKLFSRPILWVGLLLLCCFSAILPQRLLIIRVEGNERIPSRLVLEVAQEYGVGFWDRRREIRSENMKNALLSRIPELQWAGVNTYGSFAVISVRERPEDTEMVHTAGVSALVALRDGVISSVTATKGTPLVKVGQSVQKGQALISGYTDCGLLIEATDAQGAVLARTVRKIEVNSNLDHLIRTSTNRQESKYSLVIEKKRINFYKGSGICDASCVKMYEEYVLKLPGGFELPVMLIKQNCLLCNTTLEQIAEDGQILQLSEFARKYLRAQMREGRILQWEETLSATDCYVFAGLYHCEENIGVRKQEEIGEYHGKTN